MQDHRRAVIIGQLVAGLPPLPSPVADYLAAAQQNGTAFTGDINIVGSDRTENAMTRS